MNSSSGHFGDASRNAHDLSLPLIPISKSKYGLLWRLVYCRWKFVFLARSKRKIHGGQVSTEALASSSYVALASGSAPPRQVSSLKHRRSASSAAPQSDNFRPLEDQENNDLRNLPIQPHTVIRVLEPSQQGGEEDFKCTVDKIVREKDLSSLKKYGGIEGVASRLGFNLRTDLNEDVTEDPLDSNAVSRPSYVKSFFHSLFQACNKHIIFFLLISLLLSIWIEIIEHEPIYMWHEPMAILFAVLLLVSVPTATNFLKNCKEHENKFKVTVIRGGEFKLICISRTMAGDLVHLKRNDLVPADGLYVSGRGLMLDEVLNPRVDDGNPFLFSGSKVTDGYCWMLATLVGNNTMFDEISSDATYHSTKKKLLEARIDRLNAVIEVLSIIVSILVMFVQLLHLVIKHMDIDAASPERPELKGHIVMAKVMRMFAEITSNPRGRTAVVSIMTVIVMEFQHALPLVIAKSLCYWKKKVESADAKLRCLSACCTLGFVTTVCIDTTGDLICMPTETEVEEVFIGGNDMTTVLDLQLHTVVEALHRVVRLAALKPEILGNPESDMVIRWLKEKLAATMLSTDESFSILDYKSYSSPKKGGAVLVKEEGGALHLHWRGPASTILKMCSQYYDSEGETRSMQNHKITFDRLIEDMEQKGLYPIALAYRRMEAQEVIEENLTFLALVGLKFSCPEETKSALKIFSNVGVSIRLMSENDPSAAKAIAYGLGLLEPARDNLALEAINVRNLTPIQRMAKVEQMIVMGGCSSEDKVLAIQSLQQSGHSVAFCGGYSTTDMPALKEADLAIVLKDSATEMARKSSEIVIARNNIEALIPILKSGRRAYHRIQTFFQLQLTSCVTGLILTLASAMRFGDSSISSIELFLSNFIMYLSGGLMMTLDVEDGETTSPQRAKRTESMLTIAMWIKIIICVSYQVSVLLIIQFEGQSIFDIDEKVVKAMVFNSFFICQVINQYIAMKLMKKEVLKTILCNYWYVLCMGVIMVMQVLMVLFAEKLLCHISLSGRQQLICILIAALPSGLNFAVKFIVFTFPFQSSLANRPQDSRSVGARQWPYIRYWFLLPFFMILLFYTSHHFKTGIASTSDLRNGWLVKSS